MVYSKLFKPGLLGLRHFFTMSFWCPNVWDTSLRCAMEKRWPMFPFSKGLIIPTLTKFSYTHCKEIPFMMDAHTLWIPCWCWNIWFIWLWCHITWYAFYHLISPGIFPPGFDQCRLSPHVWFDKVVAQVTPFSPWDTKVMGWETGFTKVIITPSCSGGLEHVLFFHSVGNYDPNWRTHSFQRGRPPQPPTRYVINPTKPSFSHGFPMVFLLFLVVWQQDLDPSPATEMGHIQPSSRCVGWPWSLFFVVE